MREVKLPVTRYYGSKRKLVEVIWKEIEDLDIEFNSVLDLFGGSAIFSYFAKLKGKSVIYNDIFKFNELNAKALIENDTNPLSLDEALSLLNPKSDKVYKTIIHDNFDDIYYTTEENKVIDIAVQNIQELSDQKKAAAFYFLFQSCLTKRPYNLFHRKNLNLRINYTGGSFGNKVTWERSFDELFRKFHTELSEFTFSNVQKNIALNYSALNCPAEAQLVYIDPPYFRTTGHVTYHSKYHFLEGLANYDEIIRSINHDKKHKELLINKSAEFEDKKNFLSDMDKLIERHAGSNIVISYRSNGIPSIHDIETLLRKYKENVVIKNLGKYTYALNRNNLNNFEYLIIGYN